MCVETQTGKHRVDEKWKKKKEKMHFGCKEEKQQNTRTHKTFNSFKQHSSS